MISAYASTLVSKFAEIVCNRTDDVWGDGFSCDTLREIVFVRDWNEISRDEYIRVFPNLVGQRPRELSACVKDALVDLQTRISHRRSHRPWSTEHFLALLTDDMASTRSSKSAPNAYARCLEVDDLVSLHGVRHALEACEIPAYDQDLAERVAFLAAVHPAYVWPEAVIGHQLFGALGWLGIVFRGRPALMPLDIAEFFVEAILPTPKGGLVTDPSLKRRIWSDRLALSLLSSARERLQGEDRVYRLAEYFIATQRVPFEQVAT